MRQEALYAVPFEGMTFEVRRRLSGPTRRVTFQGRGTVRRAFSVMRRYGIFAARLVRAEGDDYDTHWEVLLPERVDGAERERLVGRTASLLGSWRAAQGGPGANALYREYRFCADVCCALGLGRKLRGKLLGVDPDRALGDLDGARDAVRRFEAAKRRRAPEKREEAEAWR